MPIDVKTGLPLPKTAEEEMNPGARKLTKRTMARYRAPRSERQRQVNSLRESAMELSDLVAAFKKAEATLRAAGIEKELLPLVTERKRLQGTARARRKMANEIELTMAVVL